LKRLIPELDRDVMALFWLKNVPWATILANAPGIVDGAKKLAAAMRNKPDTAGAGVDGAASGDPDARLLAIEQQQRAAAELLRSLADQNAQMAQALTVLQQRARVHLRIAIIALIAAGGALLWSLLH
jgi:hypothetical protein